MTEHAISALETERALLVGLLEQIDDDAWSAPSGCEGWTVQDVVAHMAANWQSVTNPAAAPAPAEGESFTQPGVTIRRGMSPKEVLADYRDGAGPAIELLRSVQEPPMADNPIPIATLGTYPLHLVANALAFDHYCHLRHDLLTPRGPIKEEVPGDDDALTATVEWLLAGIPQMCKDTFNPLVDKPFALGLTGPGGGSWSVRPGGEHGVEVIPGAATDAAFSVTSSTDEFVRWSTKRADWRDLAEVSDVEAAAPILDALDLE